MNKLDDINQALLKANRIIVSGHAMPDGDSVGSTLAVGLLLRAMGKQVTMLSPDTVPAIYGFLPAVGEIKTGDLFPAEVDTALILDCTDLNRLGPELAQKVAGIPTIINIDHHISNQVYGQYNFVDPKAAATGEQVYKLIKHLGHPLDQELAICLYTAIVMDTGSYRYDNTTGQTHRISAELVETGIDIADINTRLFENKELVSLQLLGKALSRLQITAEGKVAYLSLPYSMVQELGARDEHAEGIVNYPRRVQGARVGLLFREIAPNRIKVGFRSKDVDVNKIAARFGGGGHPRASGCQLEMSLEEAEQKVLAAVTSEIGESN